MSFDEKMEAKEGTGGGGVTVVGSDVETDYHIAPRTENTNQTSGSTAAMDAHLVTTPSGMASPAPLMKKKRGRPKKYSPDGSVTIALSPKPVSSSPPPAIIDFSASHDKQPKVYYPHKSAIKQSEPKFEVEYLGEWVPCLGEVGANFTPHVITVNTGEDIMMKIISFSQQGPRAVCILTANGSISSVTLRQPDSSGGTLTYEGRFEILSLTGSFLPSETGGIRNRSGGMSVALASPDGRVVGGGIAGLLVAASPVQIVVGSFLVLNRHEQKPKKQKSEPFMTMARSTDAVPESSRGVPDPNNDQGQHVSG